MNLPEDIEDAREYFKRAEKENNPEEKYDCLEQALELLDAYVDQTPNLSKEIKDYIKNMRGAYTRRLLQQLFSIKRPEFHVWLDYIVLLTSRLKNEMEIAIENDQNLKKNYDDFIKIYSKEFNMLIERVKQKNL